MKLISKSLFAAMCVAAAALPLAGCSIKLFRGHSDPFYKTLLTVDQDNPAALFGQGRLLFSQRHYDEAEPLFERLTQVQPENATAWGLLGQARLELGHYSGAQSAFEREIAMAPNAAALAGLGESLLFQGKQDEAVAVAQRIKAQYGDGAGLARLLGDIAFVARRYADAARDYENSLKFDADQPLVRSRLRDLRDFSEK